MSHVITLCNQIDLPTSKIQPGRGGDLNIGISPDPMLRHETIPKNQIRKIDLINPNCSRRNAINNIIRRPAFSNFFNIQIHRVVPGWVYKLLLIFKQRNTTQITGPDTILDYISIRLSKNSTYLTDGQSLNIPLIIQCPIQTRLATNFMHPPCHNSRAPVTHTPGIISHVIVNIHYNI